MRTSSPPGIAPDSLYQGVTAASGDGSRIYAVSDGFSPEQPVEIFDSLPAHWRWCERRNCSTIDGVHVNGAPREAAVELARRVAAAFADLPEVDAVALGGSQANLVADADSDIDLCVYARGGEVSIARRAVIAADARGAAELDNRFFEPGDEWVDGATGLGVDAAQSRVRATGYGAGLRYTR